nr:hypothetical protein [Acidimicrobiia bacterium]
MSSTVTGKGMPVKEPSRLSRLGVLRFLRLAVVFVVVAGSLGLATVTATAQSGDNQCPTETEAEAYTDIEQAGESHRA